MPVTYKRTDLLFYTFGGIDAKTATNTHLFTTDAGRKWVTVGAFIRCTAASGVLTVATVSIGSNAATYTDLVAATALTGVTAADLTIPVLPVLSVPAIIAGGTAIHANVSVAATGTSQTLEVTIIGYYAET